MTNAHKRFLDSLSGEEKMLITLCKELFESNWNKFLFDLKDRLKGRPYIFKLVNRIEEDMERVEKMQEYEKKHDVSLILLMDEYDA